MEKSRAGRQVRNLLAAFFIIAGIVSAGQIVETTTRRQYLEDFESFNSGASPSDTWYSVTTTGSGTQQAFATTATGSTKAWRIVDTATGYAAQMSNTGVGVNLCTSGQTFTHDFVGSPASTSVIQQTVATDAVSATSRPPNSIGYEIQGVVGVETLVAWVRGNSGAATTNTIPNAYTAGQILTATISQVNCAGFVSAVFTFSGAVSSSFTITGTAPLTGTLENFRVASTGTIPAGSDTLIDNYNWGGAPLPAPTVTSVTPNSGPPAGGTSVTIAGTGYKTGATVQFDGIEATGVTVVSPTQITATSPAHNVENGITVTVTNPDGQVGTLNNAYSYTTDTGGGIVVETFEDDAVGDNFPSQDWYTYFVGQTGGSSSATVVDVAGNHRFRMIANSATRDAVFQVNQSICPATVEFDLYGTQSPAAVFISNAYLIGTGEPIQPPFVGASMQYGAGFDPTVHLAQIVVSDQTETDSQTRDSGSSNHYIFTCTPGGPGFGAVSMNTNDGIPSIAVLDSDEPGDVGFMPDTATFLTFRVPSPGSIFEIDNIQITPGDSGGGGDGPADSTANPLGQAVEFFNDSWGFDGSILFGLAVVALIVFAFARLGGGPLLVAIGGFIGVAIAFALGLFPLWLLFVIIFLIIAVAGRTLFRSGDEEGGTA